MELPRPSTPTPQALKARFKQLQEQTGGVFQNWQIRLHRSLSWSLRAGQLPEDQPEARFLFLWIALNSLYSQWDPERNAPQTDTTSRRQFLQRICAFDPAAIGTVLREHRGLMRKVLGDPYLSNVFWRDPANPKARGWATEDENHLMQNLHEGQWFRVLDQVLGRLYIFRGQIVHGASTGGSRLNRTALRYCLAVLEELVPVIQDIVVERAADDDWPELCYPPMR